MHYNAKLIERLENVTYNGYQMLIKTNNDNAFLMKIEIFFFKHQMETVETLVVRFLHHN